MASTTETHIEQTSVSRDGTGGQRQQRSPRMHEWRQQHLTAHQLRVHGFKFAEIVCDLYSRTQQPRRPKPVHTTTHHSHHGPRLHEGMGGGRAALDAEHTRGQFHLDRTKAEGFSCTRSGTSICAARLTRVHTIALTSTVLRHGPRVDRSEDINSPRKRKAYRIVMRGQLTIPASSVSWS